MTHAIFGDVCSDPHRVLREQLERIFRDIVFVESIARVYSRIKQVTPDVVVILLGDDHAPACQLLSMLQMDRDTSGIPVVTWMARQETSEVDDLLAQIDQDWSSHAFATQMN